MSNGAGNPNGGAMSRLKRLVIGLLVLALTVSTLFLLAERNRRFYFLSAEGNELVVQRGTWIPYTKETYVPDDEGQKAAYAPIAIPAGVALVSEQRFEERPDLDRALFDILAGWADARVRSGEPAQLREGLALVARAAMLPGISGEQGARLHSLQAELAWFEGRERLEEAGKLIKEARRQLELATEASPARAREAVAILDDLIPSSERLARAVQTARGLRLPGEHPPAEEMAAPAPAAAPAPVPGAAPAAAAPAAVQPVADAAGDAMGTPAPPAPAPAETAAQH